MDKTSEYYLKKVHEIGSVIENYTKTLDSMLKKAYSNVLEISEEEMEKFNLESKLFRKRIMMLRTISDGYVESCGALIEQEERILTIKERLSREEKIKAVIEKREEEIKNIIDNKSDPNKPNIINIVIKDEEKPTEEEQDE